MFMTKERRIDVLGAINDNVATINEYFSIYEEIIFKKKYTLTNFEATDYGCTFKAWEHVSYNNKVREDNYEDIYCYRSNLYTTTAICSNCYE